MKIQLPAHGWKPRWYQLPAWNAMLSPEIDTTALAWHRRAGKDDIAMHPRIDWAAGYCYRLLRE